MKPIVRVALLVMVLGACGASYGSATPPTTRSQVTAAPFKSASAVRRGRVDAPAVRRDVCTAVDLDRQTPPMPEPLHVSRALVLSPPPNYARLDPAPNVNPAVSAATAWVKLTRPRGVPGGRVELLVGYISSLFPLGPKGSEIHHVLAWVLRLQHFAYAGFQGGPDLGSTSVPLPACVFTNGYIAINATTGTGIAESYGGAD